MDERRLTRREQEVVELIGRGLRGRAAADGLGMAYGTLRKHRLSILRKLGLTTSAQLAATAARVAIAADVDLDLTRAGVR